jgi:hypothetical protein
VVESGLVADGNGDMDARQDGDRVSWLHRSRPAAYYSSADS